MSFRGDRAEDVRIYLRRAGWTPDDRGVAGDLWRRNISEAEFVVAVPDAIEVGTTEWRGVIERLARFENRESNDIAFDIEHFYVDVTRFRAANESVINQSIPLVAGVGLLNSAYKILRASATTARQIRSQIGGNFSKTGDEIAMRARLGPTEHGSYIVPILMPLSVSEVDHSGGFWDDQPGVLGRVAFETSERRVTRTMAEALAAVSRIVVEPAREPTNSDISPLVASGVSRELVLAVDQVLSDPAVAIFEI